MPQMIVEKGRNDTLHLIELADAELVMSIRMWAALTGIGYSTAKKLLRNGDGPKKTRVSEHRIGITVSSHRAWLAERTEA